LDPNTLITDIKIFESFQGLQAICDYIDAKHTTA